MTPKEKCLLADQKWNLGSYDDAYKLYNEAYQEGYLPACISMGDFYYYGVFGKHDYKKAITFYQIAALKGDPKAQHALGSSYHQMGMLTDAAHWYMRAASQDFAPALNDIGYMYEHGEGVPQDACKAISYYRKGASLGNTNCMIALGWIYRFGEIVPKDNSESMRWFIMARNAGDKSADEILSTHRF